MIDWLLETFVWTAALIAAVLLLRRPVARWFGPQVAYALWAIPALRLIIPPVELPAWMRPEAASTPIAQQADVPQYVILDPATPVATTDGPAGSEAAASGGLALITPVTDFEAAPLLQIGIAVWLIGAAIFLVQRFAAYFQLRSELLDDASEVGRVGKVRLVETSGTNAPLAFGVIDKVVALPRGFLAQPDRTVRDLALAHELAHHQGRDLLINVLVQPLFALHWFNPLGRYGWLALRRDQEAACDARVVASKPAETRAAYAQLIVSIAAGPNLVPNHALTAPMACPVLGEKSIIHRLRSLNMSDTSKRRRIAGRLMLGAAVIALPLTATISYAASEAPQAPEAPAAPSGAPTPLAPPAPPSPPDAPDAPGAPEGERAERVIIEIDPDSEAGGDVRREERVFVFRSGEHEDASEDRERRVVRLVQRDGNTMSEEEFEEIRIELRRSLDEADKALAEMPAIMERAMREAEQARTEGEGRTIVRMECDNNSDDVATTTELGDGRRVVMLCQTRVMAKAREGLQQAREEIARDREMSDRIRIRILRELDRQIESWDKAQG